MASKSGAHETVLLLFVRNGASSACKCDNFKEINWSEFLEAQKCCMTVKTVGAIYKLVKCYRKRD